MNRGTTLAKTENMREIWLLGFVVMIVGLGSSTAFALDPMGPPMANLKQGQFELGADYSYSTMDLKLNKGTYVEYIDGGFNEAGEAESFTLKNFKTNRVYANMGYGFADNWGAFLRVGGANAKFGDSIWEAGERFDGLTDFSIGLGAKATFYEDDNLKIGGLFQVNWSELDGKLKPAGWPTFDYPGADCVEIELAEIQLAVGPTYKLTDNVLIYGGPFFHFVDGDLDDVYSDIERETGFFLTSKYSWAIEETSTFGGYIGARVEFTENCSFDIEYQHTSAADAFGVSLMWRF